MSRCTLKLSQDERTTCGGGTLVRIEAGLRFLESKSRVFSGFDLRRFKALDKREAALWCTPLYHRGKIKTEEHY